MSSGAPNKIYTCLMPGKSGESATDWDLCNPLLAPDPTEYVRADYVRESMEKIARAHDDLAKKYPSGPDKVKAETLRRFAEVFL